MLACKGIFVICAKIKRVLRKHNKAAKAANKKLVFCEF